MDKEKVKKKYLKKVNLIQEHNKAYYDKNKPTITDQEFDNLKKEIIELEKKFFFLKNKNSPSVSVGYAPSKNFKKFKKLFE